MVKRIAEWTLTACLLFSGSTAWADTLNVNEAATGTWDTTAYSVYRLTGSITVATGDTLVIGPGVTVLADNGCGITVHGCLLAAGSAADSIRFCASDTTEGWDGITFIDTVSTPRTTGSALSYCSFSSGKRDGSGGVMAVSYYDTLRIAHTNFTRNAANGHGGALNAADSCTVLLDDCRLTHNSAAGMGGAVTGGACEEGTYLYITACRFAQNISYGPPAEGEGGGGGITVRGECAAVISGCTIKNNRAVASGGGILLGGTSNATVTNNIIAGNTAGSDNAGGGINCKYQAAITMANNTLYGNTAGYGGAIHTSCEFDRKFTNSIIWANTALIAGDALYHGALDDPEPVTTDTVSYSCVQGGYAGSFNISAYPLFTDTAAGDFTLLTVSPCIDAGDPAAAYGNEPDPNGDRINMGAYGNTALAARTAATAGTDTVIVSGPVSGTWDTTGYRVYWLRGDVTVAPGDTLTIGPGVTVIGNSGTGIIVNGCLQAGGTVTDSITFTAANTGAGWGGIRFNDTVSIRTAKSVLTYCILSYGKNTGGGVMHVDQYDTVRIANSNFTRNIADEHGGALNAAASCIVSMDDCRFSYNSAAGMGGAVIAGMCDSGTFVQITGCTFENNTSNGPASEGDGGGGAITIRGEGSATITGCIIRSNTAVASGGGILLGGTCDAAVTNNIIAGNTAGSDNAGGGINCKYEAVITMANNTLYGNTAGYGGAIHTSCEFDRKFSNSIFWGNTALISGDALYQGPLGDDDEITDTLAYCCIQGRETGIYTINSYPVFTDTAAGDFTLGSISPCIDAGDPASAYGEEPDPDGGRINMGAYGNTALAAVSVATDVPLTVNDPGFYRFGSTQVTLDVLSITGTGTITVTAVPDSFPGNLQGNAPVKRFFHIDADTTIAAILAILTLHYEPAELAASDITDPALLYNCRYSGSDWEAIASVADTAQRTVTCTVTAFSDWAITGPGGEVPVTLSSFTAAADGQGVSIAWATVSETGNMGFNVLRSASTGAAFVKVNTALIPGNGTSTVPSEYSFNDAAGTTDCRYILEQMDTDGKTVRFGPIAVTNGPASLMPPVATGITAVTIPSPVSEPAVTIVSATGTSYRIALFDIRGMPVHQSAAGYLTAGSHTLILPATIQMGVYYMTVTDGTTVHTARIVITE